MLTAGLLTTFALMAPADHDNAPAIGLNAAPDYVDVYYLTDEREAVVCGSATYRAVVDRIHPSLRALEIGAARVPMIDGMADIMARVDGIDRFSRNAPQAARHNTWRAGYHYYDAHFLEFDVAADGADEGVPAELVLHCLPHRLSLQAFLRPEEDAIVSTLVLRLPFSEDVPVDAVPSPGGMILHVGEQWIAASTGPAAEGAPQLSVEAGSLVARIEPGEVSAGTELSVFVALLPAADAQEAGEILEAEANPLPRSAYQLEGAVYGDYAPVSGLTTIHQAPGLQTFGFEGFYDNPGMRLAAGIEVVNDGLPRRVMVRHDSPAAVIESAILTDPLGFPLPTQVQTSKNFGGEMEEPVDVHFSESYFPLELGAGETVALDSVHLYEGWGRRRLRQLSSIRFFCIYYHLSAGTTETTCFTLPALFMDVEGQARTYGIADYRPLTGETWMGQPQHEHVALQGWLHYFDGREWRYPKYEGSTIMSAGPLLAWWRQYYRSSDDKVRMTMEAVEMPQDDETRTFVRLTYDFLEDVTIEGDPRTNLRLVNKGTYIRRVHWNTAAWMAPDGEVQTAPIEQSGEWSVLGEEVRAVNGFACAYPHVDGNDSVIVRRLGGTLNGEPFQRVGFSLIGHADNRTEMCLTPLMEGQTVEAGSRLELDLIMVPYGSDHSDWRTPYYEACRWGLGPSEAAEVIDDVSLEAIRGELFGPEVEVAQGELVGTLPTMVRAEDGWARLSFSGGHDAIALVVTGFAEPGVPLLWKGGSYLDSHVSGGDWYTAFEDPDGSHGYILAPEVRTTRHGGKWGTMTHDFVITQLRSEWGVSDVRLENAEVVIEAPAPGRIELDSPRIWMPGTTTVGGRGIRRTVAETDRMRTVPLSVQVGDLPADVTVEAWDAASRRVRVTAGTPTMLTFHHLPRARELPVAIEDADGEMLTDAAGNLTVEVPAGEDVVVEVG
ncbi:MAG: hypothetical protein GF320_17775 [Armatimonadia bacterium]|nr:hypothetical protein [Armatimonadia bacterium]